MINKFIKNDDNLSGQISKKENASDFLKENIKEYAFDVAEDRALPSYRDGLKPSQRRIMKSLMDLHAWYDGTTYKSARVVGDTMGKYHAHGDSGIAGALATMVNDNASLVYGHGNWGSLTDDPASTRYTECKLSKLGMKFLECYDVAELVPNFSGELTEPVDFPTRVPCYFVNGCDGIAVGLACRIPEHNLQEIVQALKVVLKKGNAVTTHDIMQFIKGPDYKYGGKIISSKAEITSLYDKGEGPIKYECDWHITETGGKNILSITGYCPGFSPATFQNKMISLMDDGIIIYVNDNATKDNPRDLEVVFRRKEDFETYIHKHLIKTENYKFYALERTKSDSVEKDIDTKILVPNMIQVMNKWIDWRKVVETNIIDLDMKKIEDKKIKAELRLSAAEHLSIVKKALESNDTEDTFIKELPIFKNIDKLKWNDSAQYLCDLKLSALKKMDIEKIKSEIEDYTKNLKLLDNDKKHIDKVVERELDKLSEFYKPRTLKI